MNRIKNVYEVTQRLCGMIDPVGDTSVDEIRLLNLRQTIQVADRLILDIYRVSTSESSGQSSIDEAKKVAKQFLSELLDNLNDNIIPNQTNPDPGH